VIAETVLRVPNLQFGNPQHDNQGLNEHSPGSERELYFMKGVVMGRTCFPKCVFSEMAPAR
jgi:hypothetical protein